jgi:hypothetical protein
MILNTQPRALDDRTGPIQDAEYDSLPGDFFSVKTDTNLLEEYPF